MRAPMKNLILRARIIQEIRTFFQENGFLEVETPIRIPAPAPELHIEAIATDGWFLHTSPELCMKRLLSAGHTKIFQIEKCFRAQERGRHHLPEFTLLEWYQADADYVQIMNQTEAMVRRVARRLNNSETISYQGKAIDLSPPWHRVSVPAAFGKYAATTMEDALDADRFDEVMVNEIEPKLGFDKPVFLFDYPAQRGALAKLKAGNPKLAQRFELYLFGLELCNAFTELTAPADQRARFEHELPPRHKLGKPRTPMPEPFLEALSSMPEAAGIAFGLDRLVMIFADTDKIDAVVTFTPESL